MESRLKLTTETRFTFKDPKSIVPEMLQPTSSPDTPCSGTDDSNRIEDWGRLLVGVKDPYP
jgi:hypothetical protein